MSYTSWAPERPCPLPPAQVYRRPLPPSSSSLSHAPATPSPLSPFSTTPPLQTATMASFFSSAAPAATMASTAAQPKTPRRTAATTTTITTAFPTSHYYRAPRSALTSPCRSNYSSPATSPTRLSTARRSRIQALVATDPLLSRLTPQAIVEMANDAELGFSPDERAWSLRAAEGIVLVAAWLREVEGWTLSWGRGRAGEGFLPPEPGQRRRRQKVKKAKGKKTEVEQQRLRSTLSGRRGAATLGTPAAADLPPPPHTGRIGKPLTPMQLKMQRRVATGNDQSQLLNTKSNGRPLTTTTTTTPQPQARADSEAGDNGFDGGDGDDGDDGDEYEYEEVDSDEEYYGSLPRSTVEKYEARIEVITEQVEDLDVEGLKGKVLSYRTGIDNPLTSSSAVITATTLQLLPPLHRLMKMLSLWAIRLAVLKIVPVFLRWLENARQALDAGYETLRLPAIVDGSQKLDEEVFGVMAENIQQRVAAAGQMMDSMLDALEGREDVLPDSWIGMLEDIEEGVSSWEMDAERVVLEGRLQEVSKADEYRAEMDKMQLVRESERVAEEARKDAGAVEDVLEKVGETERGLMEALEAQEDVQDGIEIEMDAQLDGQLDGPSDAADDPLPAGLGLGPGLGLGLDKSLLKRLREVQSSDIEADRGRRWARRSRGDSIGDGFPLPTPTPGLASLGPISPIGSPGLDLQRRRSEAEHAAESEQRSFFSAAFGERLRSPPATTATTTTTMTTATSSPTIVVQGFNIPPSPRDISPRARSPPPRLPILAEDVAEAPASPTATLFPLKASQQLQHVLSAGSLTHLAPSSASASPLGQEPGGGSGGGGSGSASEVDGAEEIFLTPPLGTGELPAVAILKQELPSTPDSSLEQGSVRSDDIPPETLIGRNIPGHGSTQDDVALVAFGMASNDVAAKGDVCATDGKVNTPVSPSSVAGSAVGDAAATAIEPTPKPVEPFIAAVEEVDPTRGPSPTAGNLTHGPAAVESARKPAQRPVADDETNSPLAGAISVDSAAAAFAPQAEEEGEGKGEEGEGERAMEEKVGLPIALSSVAGNVAEDAAEVESPPKPAQPVITTTEGEDRVVSTHTKPVPTKAEPAPIKAEPTPTKAEPAPTKAEPTPTKAEPTPTKTEPTPTKAEPTPTHELSSEVGNIAEATEAEFAPKPVQSGPTTTEEHGEEDKAVSTHNKPVLARAEPVPAQEISLTSGNAVEAAEVESVPMPVITTEEHGKEGDLLTVARKAAEDEEEIEAAQKPIQPPRPLNATNEEEEEQEGGVVSMHTKPVPTQAEDVAEVEFVQKPAPNAAEKEKERGKEGVVSTYVPPEAGEYASAHPTEPTTLVIELVPAERQRKESEAPTPVSKYAVMAAPEALYEPGMSDASGITTLNADKQSEEAPEEYEEYEEEDDLQHQQQRHFQAVMLSPVPEAFESSDEEHEGDDDPVNAPVGTSRTEAEVVEDCLTPGTDVAMPTGATVNDDGVPHEVAAVLTDGGSDAKPIKSVENDQDAPATDTGSTNAVNQAPVKDMATVSTAEVLQDSQKQEKDAPVVDLGAMKTVDRVPFNDLTRTAEVVQPIQAPVNDTDAKTKAKVVQNKKGKVGSQPPEVAGSAVAEEVPCVGGATNVEKEEDCAAAVIVEASGEKDAVEADVEVEMAGNEDPGAESTDGTPETGREPITAIEKETERPRGEPRPVIETTSPAPATSDSHPAPAMSRVQAVLSSFEGLPVLRKSYSAAALLPSRTEQSAARASSQQQQQQQQQPARGSRVHAARMVFENFASRSRDATVLPRSLSTPELVPRHPIVRRSTVSDSSSHPVRVARSAARSTRSSRSSSAVSRAETDCDGTAPRDPAVLAIEQAFSEMDMGPAAEGTAATTTTADIDLLPSVFERAPAPGRSSSWSSPSSSSRKPTTRPHLAEPFEPMLVCRNDDVMSADKCHPPSLPPSPKFGSLDSPDLPTLQSVPGVASSSGTPATPRHGHGFGFLDAPTPGGDDSSAVLDSFDVPPPVAPSTPAELQRSPMTTTTTTPSSAPWKLPAGPILPHNGLGASRWAVADAPNSTNAGVGSERYKSAAAKLQGFPHSPAQDSEPDDPLADSPRMRLPKLDGSHILPPPIGRDADEYWNQSPLHQTLGMNNSPATASDTSSAEAAEEEEGRRPGREATPDFEGPPQPAIRLPKRGMLKHQRPHQQRLGSATTPDKRLRQYEERPWLENSTAAAASQAQGEPTVPPPRSLDEELDQRINELLLSLPHKVRLTASNLHKLNEQSKKARPLKPWNMSQSSNIPAPKSVSSERSAGTTPTRGPGPGHVRTASRRHQSIQGDIKCYHLHRADESENESDQQPHQQQQQQPPMKLYVRLVGDSRLVCRVGGGWSDLEEYLKEWATHHGSKMRAVSDSRLQIQDLPSTSSSPASAYGGGPTVRATPSYSSLRHAASSSPTYGSHATNHDTNHNSHSNHNSRPASPASGGRRGGQRAVSPAFSVTTGRQSLPGGPRAQSPAFRRSDSPRLLSSRGEGPGSDSSASSSPAIPRSLGPSPVIRGGHNGTQQQPKTPTTGSFQQRGGELSAQLTPPSPPSRPTSSGSSMGLRRTASRLSFTESVGGGGEAERQPLGLAGPRSKPKPITPDHAAWVEGLIGQVRRASNERYRGGLGSASDRGGSFADSNYGGSVCGGDDQQQPAATGADGMGNVGGQWRSNSNSNSARDMPDSPGDSRATARGVRGGGGVGSGETRRVYIKRGGGGGGGDGRGWQGSAGGRPGSAGGGGRPGSAGVGMGERRRPASAGVGIGRGGELDRGTGY